MTRLLKRTCVLLGCLAAGPALAGPDDWRAEWPHTDFARHSVPLAEIMSGGPAKDGIPSIDRPRFVPVGEAGAMTDGEPVIGLEVAGDARAYPLRVLIWHEIVNDIVGGVPVAVTYCPLCNAAVVFDRRVDGTTLEFGTTGKLRHSDLVMYDRQTESWWQQFLGEAIVGALTGKTLAVLPARLESIAQFRARAPGGRLLVPGNPSFRPYGRNPYAFYDSAAAPFLFSGEFPKGIAAMARVVAVGNEAWSLDLLRRKGTIRQGDLVLSWVSGQNSALDAPDIAKGRDVGSVVAQRDGRDVAHDVVFAFVFHAFRPGGVIHTE